MITVTHNTSHNTKSQQSIKTTGVKVWNDLPKSIKGKAFVNVTNLKTLIKLL